MTLMYHPGKFKYSRLTLSSSMYAPPVGDWYWLNECSRFLVLYVGTLLSDGINIPYKFSAGLCDSSTEAFAGAGIDDW